MNLSGISLCARYASPPNSLLLCGPENKKTELKYYSSRLFQDRGLSEIISHFSTLYPYLILIAKENHLKDPFDPRVVEAYWLGNSLLAKIAPKNLYLHLADTLKIGKNIKKDSLTSLYDSVFLDGMPHHSFHVMNVYVRTGNINIPHTVETMDACLINYGKVIAIHKEFLTAKTRPLIVDSSKLKYGPPIKRKIFPQELKDKIFHQVKLGDLVSYHWGQLCQIITPSQTKRLNYYTKLSLAMANKKNPKL